MATRKSTFDWTRIEFEYLAGEDSIREIADRHAISEGAIRKRAKAEKWVRVVRRVRKVRTSTPPQPSPPVEREREPVPDAAAIAERGRGLVSRMLDELEATTTHVGDRCNRSRGGSGLHLAAYGQPFDWNGGDDLHRDARRSNQRYNNVA